MRSEVSKSSLLMRFINRDIAHLHQINENYTTLIENFACGAFLMVAFVDSWGKARENIDL